MKPKVPNELQLDCHPTLALNVYLETNHDLTNVVERLGHFYYHNVVNGECCQPLARSLNTEVAGRRVHPDDDTWLLPFYKGYRVLIIRHWRYVTGPHAARLYYQSYQTNHLYWIATLQIDDVMFFNEDVMMERLRQAIVNHEFYIAPHSRKDIVVK